MKKLGSKLTTTYKSEIKELIYLDVYDHQDDQTHSKEKLTPGSGDLTSSATIRKLGSQPSSLVDLLLYEDVKLVVKSGEASFDAPQFQSGAEEAIMNNAVYEELLRQVFSDFAISANDIIIQADGRNDPHGREQKVISMIKDLKL